MFLLTYVTLNVKTVFL